MRSLLDYMAGSYEHPRFRELQLVSLSALPELLLVKTGPQNA